MRDDRVRIDPAGWFLSACLTLLVGAVAMSVAVRLIEAIWPWLVGLLIIVVAVQLLVAIHRRQQW